MPMRASAAKDYWPMFRGDPQLTGVAGSGLPGELDVLWTFRSEDAFSGTAAIVDDTAYVPCEDGKLYALKLADGQQRWAYDAGAPIRSSPTAYNGAIYFGDENGVFHAVGRDGARRWTFKTEGEIISSANLAAERLIFGSYDGTLYCLNRAHGALQWKTQTEDRLHGTCAIAGETVLIGGCDGVLHVVALADGRALRTVPLGAVTGSSTAVVNDRAYIGTYGNEVLAIDHVAGSVVWRFSDESREFPYIASAAVHAGLVVIGGRDKRLRAFDAETGAQKWAFATKGRIDSSPIIVGDRVFFGSSDGNLYAVSLKSGEKVWQFEAAEPITASTAVGHGRLVIGTLDGTLYCFGPKKDE
jgi:outer membrane protein assembly factor BamB